MKTIVVAWVALDGMRETGGLTRPDGVNWVKEYEFAPRAHATVWLLSGTDLDVKRARQHAKTEHGDKELARVYTFPVDEPAPLVKAKEQIMNEYAS